MKKLLLIITVSALLFGCNQNELAKESTTHNNELGFKVEYPNSWKIEDNFYYSPEMYNSREGGVYSLKIDIHESEESLDSFLKSREKCTTDLSHFRIGNRPSAQYTDTCYFNEPAVVIMETKNGIIEGISYSLSDETEEINQIMASLEF